MLNKNTPGIKCEANQKQHCKQVGATGRSATKQNQLQGLRFQVRFLDLWDFKISCFKIIIKISCI